MATLPGGLEITTPAPSVDALVQSALATATNVTTSTITTGGTGISPRDYTPEALLPLFNKEIPGVGELLRSDGARYTPLSWSSRAVGGIMGNTLVITLPGNPAAVKEGLNALLPKLIPHLIRISNGEK